MEQELITQEKLDQLQDELHNLKTVERPLVGERVATARALGDLSENAEYHAARSQQGKLESRIMEIESILKRAVIIKRSGSTNVELGATVIVQKDGDTEMKTYMIVSDTEADLAQGKLSINSPMGLAIIGKSSGDTFEMLTPRGTVSYKIISIS